MKENALISLRGIRVDYDDEPVLKGIDLDIMDKEFITFLGPSGCGKTTTLRIIGGFIQPKEGDVFFGGVRINDLPPYKREVNTVFQRYALFPHLNVYENVEFGLKVAKVPEKERRASVKEMLKLVGLSGYDKRHINQLSGGQQQRVAIARALVNRPKVLLLDEPLGALDLKLRKEMQIELKRIQQALEITFIYVTHDQEEALTMSDRVVVMRDGNILQIGTPQAITSRAMRSSPISSGKATLLTALCTRTFWWNSPTTTLTVWIRASSPGSGCRSLSVPRTSRSSRRIRARSPALWNRSSLRASIMRSWWTLWDINGRSTRPSMWNRAL